MQHRYSIIIRRPVRIAAVAAAAIFAQLSLAAAQTAPSKAIVLAPHRAVYELTLDKTSPGSNVTDIRGQLVYDFKGSSCEGYTLNTRLTTEIFDREGKPSITDIRSESFEQGDGGRFRFSTSQYLNNQLGEAAKGLAWRKTNHHPAILVELEKPKRGSVTLGGNVFFPTQHSLAILKAATSGESRLHANVYDGSEKGAKVYETTTFIGSPLDPSENAKLPPVKNAAGLDSLKAWPIVISYYDQGETKDGLPTYEVSFRMYENGVSRKLKLDYGTFALRGELSSIEFLKAKACAPSRSANPARTSE